MKLNTLLSEIGFSENETRVYLAALELGKGSAQRIAKVAGVPRTTAYAILEKLVGRGVVGKTLERGKLRFVGEPPSRLVALVRGLEYELEQNLPELEAVFNKNGAKPKIIFYEGKEAIQKVYDDTLAEAPEEILEWNTDEFFEHDKYHIDRLYIDKRVKKKIHAKRIAAAGSRYEKNLRFDRAELSETRIVPANVFSPDIEVNIYNNKVAFINYVESMSIIIESPAIAKAMKQAYELSWKGAKLS